MWRKRPYPHWKYYAGSAKYVLFVLFISLMAPNRYELTLCNAASACSPLENHPATSNPCNGCKFIHENANTRIKVGIVDRSGKAVAIFDDNISGSGFFSFKPPATMRLGSQVVLGAHIFNTKKFDLNMLKCRWEFPEIYGKLKGKRISRDVVLTGVTQPRVCL